MHSTSDCATFIISYQKKSEPYHKKKNKNTKNKKQTKKKTKEEYLFFFGFENNILFHDLYNKDNVGVYWFYYLNS